MVKRKLVFARFKLLWKARDEDRCPICGEAIVGEGVERYGIASAAAGTPTSTAHRPHGGGGCAGRMMRLAAAEAAAADGSEFPAPCGVTNW